MAAGIIVGKTVLLWLLAMALRWPRRVAVATGLCLAQIGEFSFVIGSLAHDGGVIDYEAMQLLLSASLVTLLVAPMLAARTSANQVEPGRYQEEKTPSPRHKKQKFAIFYIAIDDKSGSSEPLLC